MQFFHSTTIPALLAAGLLCCTATVQASRLIVKVDNDLVSIDAVNVSLIAVANRLSEITDIPFTYTEGNDMLVSLNIVEEPIRTAVTKLSENNVVVTRVVAGEVAIAEIMILLPEPQAGQGLVDANVSNANLINGNLPSGDLPSANLPVQGAISNALVNVVGSADTVNAQEEQDPIKAQIFRIAQANEAMRNKEANTTSPY